MFIYLLFVYLAGSQIGVSTQEQNQFVLPKNDLERLNDLKYYLCGLSPVHYSKGDKLRGIGWFCVHGANCSGTEKTNVIAPGSEDDVGCKDVRYNEGRDTCCFTGKLNPPVAFKDPQNPDYTFPIPMYTFVKNESIIRINADMKDYERDLFEENLGKTGFIEEVGLKVVETLRNHSVCSVLPSGKKDGKTLWTPYICVESDQCKDRVIIHEIVYYSHGDRFCARGTFSEPQVCCHIAATLEILKNENILQLIEKDDVSPYGEEEIQINWKFFELESNQSYAPGFRAKFMCEVYNKLVCDGQEDRCAQRVLHRTGEVLPGEFPHHALVGIALPKRQTFHCQGSIVSRLFVLTSKDCESQSHTLANVVLVGNFNFDPDRVTKNERLSYVKTQFSQPDSHWLLLLKLWRPLHLNAFIKPACIDWFSNDENLSSKFLDFGTGWIIGYGPSNRPPDPTNAKFKTKIIRNNYNFQSTKTLSLEEENNQYICTLRMSAKRKEKFFKQYKTFNDSDNHICILGRSVYSPYLEKQLDIDKSTRNGNKLGYLSRGASFSVFERYCQWKVYGVFIQDENEHFNKPPLLIETVPYATSWLEEFIWREDFNFLSFDLSWPDCADWENSQIYPVRKAGKANKADHQFNFYSEDYLYVKPEHDEFF